MGYKLAENQDYVDMIKTTRKYADDDEEIHSWMSGIPYDYWEQYLTTYALVWETGAWIAVAGLLAGVALTFVHLTMGQHGTCCQRVTRSMFAGLLIGVILFATHVTVFGLVLLGGIPLSGFAVL